jgi:NTE family protein
MVFHLGALWRLNEAGYLPKLNRISSVSGGSITAGVLGLKWNKLTFDVNGVAQNFAPLVVEPVRRLASKTIDEAAIIEGMLLPGKTITEEVADVYREYLFGDATLQSLPNRPRFVLNATSVQTKALFRFSKPYMGDYHIGLVKYPTVSLAVAVGASSAFPPVLSPVEMKLDPNMFDPDPKADLQRVPYTSDVVLTDGGAYDNLCLETAWKRYDTILISDGGRSGRTGTGAEAGLASACLSRPESH